MTRVVLSFVLLAACSSSGERRMVIAGGDDDPVGPGSGVDASVPRDGTQNGDATGFSGRVCVVSDMRMLDTGCATTGADGLTVTLGGSSAMTAADGSFTMDPPAGTGLYWHVTGEAIVPTVMPFAVSTLVPAVPKTLYDQVSLSNGVVLSEGQGSAIVRVLIETTHVPIAGMEAVVSPAAQYAPYYDGASPTIWNQNTTGTAGITWIPGIPTGDATITLFDSTDSVAKTVMIDELSITFAIAEVD